MQSRNPFNAFAPPNSSLTFYRVRNIEQTSNQLTNVQSWYSYLQKSHIERRMSRNGHIESIISSFL